MTAPDYSGRPRRPAKAFNGFLPHGCGRALAHGPQGRVQPEGYGHAQSRQPGQRHAGGGHRQTGREVVGEQPAEHGRRPGPPQGAQGPQQAGLQRNWPRICRSEAPRALRSPISKRRSEQAMSITDSTPTPPTSSTVPARHPNTVLQFRRSERNLW